MYIYTHMLIFTHIYINILDASIHYIEHIFIYVKTMHIQYTHRLLNPKFTILGKKQYITFCILKGGLPML